MSKAHENIGKEQMNKDVLLATLLQVQESANATMQTVVCGLQECSLEDLNEVAIDALALLENIQRATIGECEVCHQKAELRLHKGRIICVSCAALQVNSITPRRKRMILLGLCELAETARRKGKSGATEAQTILSQYIEDGQPDKGFWGVVDRIAVIVEAIIKDSSLPISKETEE